MGIDVGTQSSKGVLVTPDGVVVASHTVPHGMDVPKPGWAEQDADAVWWSDVKTVCRELLSGDIDGDDVIGVGVSAIGPCLLPLDASGKPLRKGILYGVDTRATEEIGILEERLGKDEVFRFSGMPFTSQAIGPKILWLQRHEPEVWEATQRLTTASSYLVYRLTGEHVMDRHTASHYMPLMDIEKLEWSDRFADEVAPLEMLPRLAWSDERAGSVSDEAAEATGLRSGTPVAVGAVDALSEAISVGVTRPGDLMIMYGSTTFFIGVLEEPLPDERVWMTAGAFEDQYALAAGMSTTGSLTRWFRDQFARDYQEGDAYAALFDGAKDLAPGADGLVMLPYFSGERTPINDPHARGVIAGLSLSHTREHLFRAVLESVGFGIRHNLEVFRNMGAEIDRIAAVGGGTQTEFWPQIVSDICGIEQRLPKQTMGACYGDAFLAGLAAGRFGRDMLQEWVSVRSITRPDRGVEKVYDERYRVFRELYEATKGVVHTLSRE